MDRIQIPRVKDTSKVQSRFIVMPTSEERRVRDLGLFKDDAAVTIIFALLNIVTHLVMKAADMVELSHKSEWREKYGILKDYSLCADTMGAVVRLRSQVRKCDRELGMYVSLAHGVYLSDQTDASENIVNRLETVDEEFKSDYESIRRNLVAVFRPVKVYDPVIFYAIVYAIYMTQRFDNIGKFLKNYSSVLSKDGMLMPLMRFRPMDALCDLLDRCQFHDKAGNRLVFFFSNDDAKRWEALTAKRSWQAKNRDVQFRTLSMHEFFQDDTMMRSAWTFEHHLMSLETIDRIILASEGKDPMYRKDFSFRRIQICGEYYEQAMLAHILMHYGWSQFPRRLRNYLDLISQRPVKGNCRKPKPVVAYHLVPLKDKKGNPVIGDNGEPDTYVEFDGLWNSIYEAQREMGVPWQNILRSMRNGCCNDGFDCIWLSFESYVRMLYDTLVEHHPDIAAEALSLCPEIATYERPAVKRLTRNS